MVHMIGEAMGIKVENYMINRVDFHSSRPGHDLRYALDGTRLKRAGWFPPVALDTSLKKSVQWTIKHPEWLRV